MSEQTLRSNWFAKTVPVILDLNLLLHRHQLSLMIADRALTRREKRVHDQFASEYAEQIRFTRAALGARGSLSGLVT